LNDEHNGSHVFLWIAARTGTHWNYNRCVLRYTVRFLIESWVLGFRDLSLTQLGLHLNKFHSEYFHLNFEITDDSLLFVMREMIYDVLLSECNF